MRTTLRGPFGGAIVHQLERLFHHGTAVGLTEGELLERFVRGHDEAAFEVLMARHGPMVLGICRRLLRDPNDVDDAFQATFLVLVRKAGTLRRRDLLGNWLYGVAHRVAIRSRGLAARRLARVPHGQETIDRLDADGAGAVAVCDNSSEPDAEPSPWLLEEVRRLPEKYRAPVVLCYLEGLTHEEAAARLGWPIGTVKGRLARARDRLRRRLTRRGVALSTAAPEAHLALPEGLVVSESLKLATLKAAQAVADGAGRSILAAASVSLPVATLAHGVSRAMIMTQVKPLSLILLVAGTVTTGFVIAAAQGPARKDQPVNQPVAADAGVKSQGAAPQKTSPAMKGAAQTGDSQAQPDGTYGMMRMMQGQMMRGQMGKSGASDGEFRSRLQIAVLESALADFEKDVDSGQIKKGSVRERLEKPLAMAFANPTPLDDVLKYIKAATTEPNGKPIPIYVDPKGLGEVGASLNATVTIDLDGVPLKMSLRLMLKQLGLAYCVRDGVIIISSVQGVREELAEAAGAAFGHDPKELDEIMSSMGIRTSRGLQ